MRIYKKYKYENPRIVEEMLAQLADKGTDVESYRNAFYMVGQELGHVLLPQLPKDFRTTTLLACASEDADWLAKGFIAGIEAPTLPISVFWSLRCSLNSGVDVAPIIRSYQDNLIGECKNLIIIKSIISSSCVVKTQILRLISIYNPDKIFIVAPVMFKNAQDNLSKEFPKEVSDKFSFLMFAIDDEIINREIIPGIGGMVYPRLGLGDEVTKNQYIPRIVMERMSAP